MMKEHEVVISGVSGSFPECLNVQELEQNIFNDENFVNDIDARWKTTEVPRKTGKIKKSVKFDDTFFGIHRKLTIILDPHAKHSFEKTYEAICDAGRNPQDFYNTNTAMLMASSINETEGENMLESKHIGHLILGYSRCMQSNRVSYAFNFSGPSVTLLGSWEAGMTTLETARNLIAKGHVRQAVVGATNMIFYPQISRHFQAQCKLNDDGKTKSFSADADGYSRSDGIVVFFLQRADDAIRSYGTLVKAVARAEMKNACGILEPLGFSKFLGEFYDEAPIKATDVAYIQADGCASLKTDAMELEAVSEVLCPGRSKPLPVTSIKPKLGHTEAASALVSVVSALIAMKTGYIPPVLHYTKANPLVPSLKDGRIKIVTEKTPLEGDYVGVNAIGLCSSFGHTLLKRNPKSRRPVPPDYFPQDNIPRLFLLSGRDEIVMKSLLHEIENSPVYDDFYAMNHLLFKTEFPKHLFRGFSIKSKTKHTSQITPYSGGEKRPIWYIFSGMGSQWVEMGRGIMMVPLMRKSIEQSHKYLEPKGIDLISIITNDDPKIYDNILHCFVGIAAIQIALLDLLDELGVKADGFVGHSVGELGCSYADKCLTAEQTILAAYARGKASNEAKLIKGMMAAVGRGYKEMRNQVPEGIEVACHNSDTSCTLSGPTDIMTTFVAELKSKGVFAKLVNVANIAYHSKNITPAAPLLLRYLKEIIPEPKLRSSKWISSSIPITNWDTDLARYCSAEYHTNNLLSYVLFEEAVKHVPENAICIEIAPHGLLQAIVKKSMPNCTHIPLTNRAKEGCAFTIEALALAYSNGIEIDLTKLYPEVEYPLPRETPYLHPFITWNHSEDWVPISLERNLEDNKRNRSNKETDLFSHPEELYQLSLNHRVSDNTVFPSVNLLSMMMEYMAEKLHGTLLYRSYEFQDLKFHEHLILDRKSIEKLKILYQNGSGNFEIVFGETVLLAGLINPMSGFPETLLGLDMTMTTSGYQDEVYLNEDSVYEFFKEKECSFNNEYRNITDIKIFNTAFIGRVKWRGIAEYYIDGILKLIMLYQSIKKDRLVEIESVGQLIFDPSSLPEEDKDVFVYYNSHLDQLAADGVRLAHIGTRSTPFKQINPEIEKCVFQPYSEINSQDVFFEACLKIISDLAGNETIYVVGVEKCYVFDNILQSAYFNNLLKTKANIKVVDLKDVDLTKDSGGTYLFISDVKLTESLVNLIDSSNHTCYLIQSASQCDTQSMTRFKCHTPILERNIGDLKLVFFKKTINVIMEANFIQVPEGFLLENPDPNDEVYKRNKSNFFFFKYTLFSDIPFVLEASKAHFESENVRFVFVDQMSATFFDPTQNFYQLQLRKDLKVNVCHKESWGMLKDVLIRVPVLPEDVLQYRQTPLNKLRCDSVDLKVVGLNLQNLVNPSIQDKFGILDYTGETKDKGDVMGLGILTSDNNLKVDPILVWKKPPHWTLQQAASVPLYYSLAYYILGIKRLPELPDLVPIKRVFIHGGHSAFSQAVISVVLAMKASIYTSCYTQQQKQFILKRFPQIEASNIYVLDRGSKYMFDVIIESTNGEGVDLVIDCLDDDGFRSCILRCLAHNAQYFYFCHSDNKSDFSIGMNIFMKETSVIGINPDILLGMTKEKKLDLVKLVEDGIKKGYVVPLNTSIIEGDCKRRNATEAVVSWSRKQEEAKKVLLNIEKSVEPKPTQESSLSNGNNFKKKSFLVIGYYNNLWYDITSWLASKGADSIFIVIEWNTIPIHQKFRFKSLVERHGHLKIRLLGIEHLKSSEKMDQSLLLFGETLDKVFYIVPGMENELEMVNNALKKHSKNSYLVCIGSSTSTKVTNQRIQEGFKGVSLLLKKETLRNRTIINVLDHWLSESDQKDPLILMDEHEQNEIDTDANDPDILPRTAEELVDLMHESSEIPYFKEVPTASPPNKVAKELDPVFFFPGFRVSKMRNFISKFTYPSFMAKYPTTMKSYDEVASHLAKELLKFDMYLYNLVAEGWAGPLVLKVASLLEKDGKISQIVLLDATPSTIRKWSKAACHSEGSLISRCISSLSKDEEITVDQLRSWKDTVVDFISKRENQPSMEDEVKRSMDMLIDRLQVLDSMKELDIHIASKVHIFTARQNPMENHKEVTLLHEVCRLQCSHHVMDDATIDTLLDSKNLMRDLRNLSLVEYKTSARKQNVSLMSTLEIRELR